MKRQIAPIICVVSVLMTGCSDDNIVFNAPPQIRAYETDAAVLSRFVEVNDRTGLFSINPDKKVTATDYVVNRSREQLLEISSINRARFEREMEQANNLIKAYREADNVSVIYTILTSGPVINNEGGTMRISKLQSYNAAARAVARLSVSGDDICRTGFYSMGDNRLTVSCGNTSTFYVSRIAFVTSDDTSKGTILLAGLGINSLPYSYSLVLPEVNGEYLNIQGKSLMGNGNVTVGILE